MFISTYGDFHARQWRYRYVGLPGVDAVDYVNSEYILGAALSALMRIPPDRRATHKAQALQRIAASSETDQAKFLLAECVEAYLQLNDPDEQAEFESLLNTEPYHEAKKMVVTTYEQGIEQGIEQGEERARRETALMYLENRFGALSESVRTRVAEWPADQLPELLKRIFDAASLEELNLEE